jgi:biotin-(acetyl-CoA carboxylase) ligase
MDIDGEGMEYIINGVGMNDQMLRQLIMNNPESDTKDLLEEKVMLSDTRLEETKIWKIIKVMNEFEENNPEQLRQFIKELDNLIDKYHANIYLLDDVFEGTEMIKQSVQNQLRNSNL